MLGRRHRALGPVVGLFPWDISIREQDGLSLIHWETVGKMKAERGTGGTSGKIGSEVVDRASESPCTRLLPGTSLFSPIKPGPSRYDTFSTRVLGAVTFDLLEL
jgi:hypothetical protein